MSSDERLMAVLAYIENHLDEALDLDDLCAVAHWSRYHFHRRWRATFAMSPSALVRVLRRKRAAFQLAFRRQHSVLRVALEAGYTTSEAFSRAFKSYFERSPSQFRRSPNWHPWLAHYQPILRIRSHAMPQPSIAQIERVERPAVAIAVMQHRGSPHALGASLARFIAWRKQYGLSPRISRTFNLIYDDPSVTPPADFRFGLACSVRESVPPNELGIHLQHIPAGRFARLRHQGSDDGLGAVVETLLYRWLPESAHRAGDFPIFFERLSFFPEVPEARALTDVYLPLG